MINITTKNLRGESAPLYSKYPREFKPQPAYIEMTEDGDVSADYSGEIGDAIPMYVWNKRTLRWNILPSANGDSLADWLESAEISALLERIHDGHTVDWNGSNYTGHLDDDAQAASDELDRILNGSWALPYDTTEVWDAKEWLAEGFDIDQVIEEGIAGYAATAEDYLDNNQAIDGNLEDATVSLAAVAVQRHIDDEIVDSQKIRSIAEMLADYSPAEYADLLAAYRAEFDASHE